MGPVIGAVILLFGGAVLGRAVSGVRQSAWAGPRSSGMRQRAASGDKPRTIRQEIRLMREKAHLDNWRAQEDHDRKNGHGPQAVTGGTPAAAKTPLLRQMRDAVVVPFQRRPASTETGSGGHAPAAVAPPDHRGRSAGGAAGEAAPPVSPPQAPAASNGRTATVPTTTTGAGAAEKLIEGVNQIHAEAQAGGIRAKQAALKACHEACVRFASMASMLSRQMAEPGMNYGTEITEPIAKSAVQLQASAMTFSEADANLTTLANMTVGDLADSARQAPHHTQLSENGSH